MYERANSGGQQETRRSFWFQTKGGCPGGELQVRNTPTPFADLKNKRLRAQKKRKRDEEERKQAEEEERRKKKTTAVSETEKARKSDAAKEKEKAAALAAEKEAAAAEQEGEVPEKEVGGRSGYWILSGATSPRVVISPAAGYVFGMGFSGCPAMLLHLLSVRFVSQVSCVESDNPLTTERTVGTGVQNKTCVGSRVLVGVHGLYVPRSPLSRCQQRRSRATFGSDGVKDLLDLHRHFNTTHSFQ